MKKLISAVFVFLSFLPALAHAEVFVWKDPSFDIKVTYPDVWMRQAQLDDDLRLFVVAGQGRDHAACRLYVRRDERFISATARDGLAVSAFVFPQSEIQTAVFQRPDVDMVRVTQYSDLAGIGNAPAVRADVLFEKTWVGDVYPMRARVFAAQYDGNRIVMSCEALASAWPQWEPAFGNIFKSVSFASAYAIEPHGLYRIFENDEQVSLPVNKRRDGITVR